MATTVRTYAVESLPLFHFHPGSMVLALRSSSNEPLREEVLDLAPATGARALHVGARTHVHSDALRRARRLGLAILGEVRVEEGPFTEQVSRLDGALCDMTACLRMSDLRVREVLDELHSSLSTVWLELKVHLLEELGDQPIDRLTFLLSERLGPMIPLHLVPSSVGLDSLESHKTARWIAISNGLHWVYGEPEPASRNTWCPGCSELLVTRAPGQGGVDSLDRGRCPRCGWSVPGVFSGRESIAAGHRFIAPAMRPATALSL